MAEACDQERAETEPAGGEPQQPKLSDVRDDDTDVTQSDVAVALRDVRELDVYAPPKKDSTPKRPRAKNRPPSKP